MSARINHADEAMQWRNAAPEAENAIECLALAQVHATLALVEQQRIANLIDFLPHLDNTVRVDTFDMDRPLPTKRDDALAEIRKGLGL